MAGGGQVEGVGRHVRHGASTPIPSGDPVPGAPAGESGVGGQLILEEASGPARLPTEHRRGRPSREAGQPIGVRNLDRETWRASGRCWWPQEPQEETGEAECPQPVRGACLAGPEALRGFGLSLSLLAPLGPSLTPVPGAARGRPQSWPPEDPLGRGRTDQEEDHLRPTPPPSPAVSQDPSSLLAHPSGSRPPSIQEPSAVAPESSHAGAQLTSFPRGSGNVWVSSVWWPPWTLQGPLQWGPASLQPRYRQRPFPLTRSETYHHFRTY